MPVVADKNRLLPQASSTSPDLGHLAVTGKESPLLVYGDGLAAGWRDGGIYRASQLTAFPNLVAQQMGLANFSSPLFDEEHGNGTGYLLATPIGNKPRWTQVTNNLAVAKSTDLPELVPYSGGDVSNYAAPKLNDTGFSGKLSPSQGGWIYAADGRGWTDDMVFLWRLKPQADKYSYSYWDLLRETLASKKPALVFSVFGFDHWADTNVKSDNVQESWVQSTSERDPLTVSVASYAKAQGATAVIFTIPDFKQLPYFNWYTLKGLQQLSKEVSILRSRDNADEQRLQGEMIFLPTKNTESLFETVKRQGGPLTFRLTDKDVADQKEIISGSTKFINDWIRGAAAKQGFLVVDLAALYEKIYAGSFVTDDGLAIDGSPKGNFFSADGLYPSAIGNAVIANETIKVLNQQFQARIPLINVSQYATNLAK